MTAPVTAALPARSWNSHHARGNTNTGARLCKKMVLAAANTIFLHNLAPVFVFPLAWWLFQERAGSAAVTGAVIALFGVALLSGVSLFQVSHFASSRFLLGDFLAFV